MDYKLLGSILVIGYIGRCGHAGASNCDCSIGLYPFLVLLFVCWFVMTAVLLLLEVNLWILSIVILIPWRAP